MSECHLCGLQYSQRNNQPNNFLAKCCMKKCSKKYCIECIHQKFDSEFQNHMYKSDTWICYSCQNICLCINCKAINNSEKKVNKKKNLTSSGTKQQIRVQIQKQQTLEDYYREDLIASAPPFMKRVLQTRNHIYKLMANSTCNQSSNKIPKLILPQKTEEPNKEQQDKSIKHLIKRTLKQYNEDEIDIQLID